MNNKRKIIYKIGYLFSFLVLNILLCLTGILSFVNNYVMDTMYQKEGTTNPDIKIIAIDDKSLNELGKFSDWSREYYTTLVKKLNSDNHMPAVIAFDILFTGVADETKDLEFANICGKYDNIIVAMNLLFGTNVTLDDYGFNTELNVTGESVAYKELYENTESGFVNTILDENDGYVRKCIPVIEYNGKEYDSFSYKIYKKYQEYNNHDINKFITNETYRFNYSSLPEEQYTIVSFSDVINGKIPLTDFEGSIVLVGAFAEGLQDSISVPISRGEHMFGVQVHANIIEAYINDNFVNDVSSWVVTLISSLVVLVLVILIYNRGLIKSSIICLSSFIVALVIQTILFKVGYYVPLVSFAIVVLIMYASQIIYQYVYEKHIKVKALKAFKKYVDPRVVDNVIKTGNYEINLGGEKVDIACLFVDIRGFTSISESLDPTDVVVIINEYLSLTSKAILNNKGTLDKYIGDATMAIFNAPFATDDYIYNAVLTGLEIAAGSAEIEKKFLEKYGKKVSFGIGINCGKAVVGNIGSTFRMDYTAIGDTVNTAARLESNAKAGEILISEAVYEAVKDKIEAEFVDSFQFKGKKELVKTYRVKGRK